MKNILTITDVIVFPLMLVVAYFLAARVKNRHVSEKPYYRYFGWGLTAKIAAGLAFAAVYIFYYGGGDTIYYFWGSGNIVNMLGKDIPTFFKLMAGNRSAEVFSMFDRTTGWPTYFRDGNSFAVCRFNAPLYMLSFRSYLGNTVLMNLLLYFGVWRFYEMLVTLYPKNEKWLAIGVLFIPSVVFWSSGILKDGWTLTAILFMFTSFYKLFVERQQFWRNLLVLLFWSYISFQIRPYIFYVTVGSGLIWLSLASIKSIKSSFLRTIALPAIIIASWLFGATIIAQTGELAGERYSSMDAMLETAWIIQDDLRKDYYGGNSFDIGSFEPTLMGILKKAPQAIMAGLFRPFIWEGEGILMILSGLENLALLLLFFWGIFKLGPLGFVKQLFQDPFVASIFVFAVTYSFFVGLTTANFGALVRYVIPGKMLMVLVLVILLKQKEVNTEAK